MNPTENTHTRLWDIQIAYTLGCGLYRLHTYKASCTEYIHDMMHDVGCTDNTHTMLYDVGCTDNTHTMLWTIYGNTHTSLWTV